MITDDLERTSRDTTLAQWGVAGVVMTGSAIAGGFTFHYLGESSALGVITALAVDLALATWLRIGRRLRDVGVTTITGLILEVVTLGQTLFLNIGSAVFRGINHDSPTARVFLGVAHSFLPVVLFLISLAGGEAQHKLATVRRNKLVAVAAERERLDALASHTASQALDAARVAHDKVAELREQADEEMRQADLARATAATLRATTEAEIAATKTAEQELRRVRQDCDNPTPDACDATAATPGATREQRREWVRQHIAIHGEPPTGAAVDDRFGPPRTGAKVVAEVLAEPRKKTTLKVVPGGTR